MEINLWSVCKKLNQLQQNGAEAFFLGGCCDSIHTRQHKLRRSRLPVCILKLSVSQIPFDYITKTPPPTSALLGITM